MTELKRATVLLTLLERLKAHGSWCGETHLQKSTYFLQELLKVPLDFNFIFYKHGPYSFDLSDAITGLRADQLLGLKLRDPYGPTLVPLEGCQTLLSRFPITRKRYEDAVEFAASRLGGKTVAGLERLATALYVTLEDENASVADRAMKVHQLKKHVPVEEARIAIADVDAMIRDLASSDNPSE